MAYKISHRVVAQELRFPNKPSAERYADSLGGGLHRWNVERIPGSAANPTPVISQRGRGQP